MRRKPWRVTALALVATVVGAQAVCPRPSGEALDARIDTLIARMTVAERIAQLQDRAPAIPRLGLPAYNWWNEGLHGLARDGYATVFPQAIGLAATWDPALVHDVGDTVSTEARAKFQQHANSDSPRYGGLTVWSPNINIFRDPRWGRGQETYGEDPFLTATLGVAFIHGVQGDDPFFRKADATPKHFVAHSGPEQGRDGFNAQVSTHDLADTYLPAFHAAVTQGNSTAIMCSYNAVDGTPACANHALLQDTVRDAWGFGGYVVSDCDAVGNLTDYQHFTADAAHGSAAALNAGVDLNCGNTYASLNDALAQGLVTETTIDRALHRLLRAKAQLGILEPVDCSPVGPSVADTPKHRALARKAAEESIVLLRNDGALPLRHDVKIAVVGASADMLGVLEANYHGTASAPVTPLEGLRERYPSLRYAQGSLLAMGVVAPIPRDALHVGSGADSAPGLRAEYFNQPSFNGRPTVTATVSRVDLDLDRVGPAPAINATQYAARWSGTFTPPAPGDYVLNVKIERCWDCTAQQHDHFTLTLDGKPAIVNRGAKIDADHVTLHCRDTRPHTLKLELLHTGLDEGITLAWEPPAEPMLQQAEQVAQDADAIVVFAGLSPDLEGEALGTHLEGFAGGDRTSLGLPETQRALIRRMQATGKPVVLVLLSGSAVALDATERKSAAVLEGWYPGEEGGHALADVLSGVANPSGRLPVTFYESSSDLPAFTDYSMANRTYRYFHGPVLYPFGFGLSYTTFAYGSVQLSKKTLQAGEPLEATVEVTNTGAVDGTEVVEAYIVPPALPGAPRWALAGTKRIHLRAGERQAVQLDITPQSLSLVDDKGQRAVESGEYRLFVGGAQPKAGQGTAFHIHGHKPL